jgi:hypothetical protein
VTRIVAIAQPGVDGMITDIPAYAIGPRASVLAQDLITPKGIAQRRMGAVFDGSVADTATILQAAWRAAFVLANASRTITTDATGAPASLFSHNPAAAATLLQNWVAPLSGVALLPRCMYRDELILCWQDGISPLVRYSGSLLPNLAGVTGATNFNAGKSTVTTATALPATANSGSYLTYTGITGQTLFQRMDVRITEQNSTTSITLEDVRSSLNPGAIVLPAIQAAGGAWPGVSVYSTGTVSVAANVVTGTGTRWLTAPHIMANGDALAVPNGAFTRVAHANAASSDTATSAILPNVTDVVYALLRRLPFTDATTHRNSLWGTGVRSYPTRVYASPPGWNPSLPPGAVAPFDPTVEFLGGPADMLLFAIDVPALSDGDPCVALLSTPNPLIVLKRRSAHLIYGAYPSFSQTLLDAGVGCIDLRSAISVDGGQYWCDEHGVWTYDIANNRCVDLTRGKINREWRALMAEGVGATGWCTAGVVHGYLLVSVKTAAATLRSYAYDLRTGAWTSRVPGLSTRFMQSVRVPGEVERLLYVQDSSLGRVNDFSPAISGFVPNATFTQAVTPASATDASGAAPSLKLYTGSGILKARGLDDETELHDVVIHANVMDAGAAGATKLTPTAVVEGSLDNPAQASVVTGTCDSTATDGVRRYERSVNRPGRQIQLRLDETTASATLVKLEVPMITAYLRDAREDT